MTISTKHQTLLYNECIQYVIIMYEICITFTIIPKLYTKFKITYKKNQKKNKNLTNSNIFCLILDKKLLPQYVEAQFVHSLQGRQWCEQPLKFYRVLWHSI